MVRALSHTSSLLAALGGLAFLALAGASLPALAQDKAAPQVAPQRAPGELKIGVVDLSAIFKKYQRSAELEKKINDERDKLKFELEEQKKAIQNILKELEVMNPEGETYELKEDEKDAAVARYDRLKKRMEERIKKRWEEYNRAVLEDIEAVVRDFGEENKFSMILKVDGASNDEARLLMGLKAVMYYSRELDVTSPVVDLLNRRYEKEAAKRASEAGAGRTAAPPAPRPATGTAAPAPTNGKK